MISIKYYDVVQRCRELELAEGRNLRYGVSKVRMHNKNETMLHFMAKSMLSKMLWDGGSGVLTEVDFRNGRTPDILQITKNSFITYEIESKGETNKSECPNCDEMIIDLRKVPKEALEGLKSLETWLKGFIV